MKIFLVAMAEEREGIFLVQKMRRISAKPFPAFYYGEDVIIQTGIGKVNASSATQYAIDNFNGEKIINAGLVGCFNTDLEIGEVILISEGRFFDVDVTPFGYQPGQYPGMKNPVYRITAQKYFTGCTGLKRKKIVTGDSFINNRLKLGELGNMFRPDVVDMELTAIAHVLKKNQQLNRLMAVKAISDFAGQNATGDFKMNQAIAFSNISRVINSL